VSSPPSPTSHLTGFKSNGTNFGNLFGAMEDFKYLAGMVAGSRAKKDGNTKLGYMATFPIPEEVRLGNAIMLGAKKTCPECTMEIRWINTWHGPQQSVTARRRCSTPARRSSSQAQTPAPTPTWPRKRASGRLPTTTRPPARAKEKCLTAPYWVWGPVYAQIANEVIAKTYKPGYQYFDADSKAMGLWGFMDGETLTPGVADLPAADLQMVRDTLGKFLDGSMDRFSVFTGPIKDNTGAEILAAGEKLDQADLDQFPPGATGNECDPCMHWLAEGINGTIPASNP
jgi:basic membrane protein A